MVSASSAIRSARTGDDASLPAGNTPLTWRGEHYLMRAVLSQAIEQLFRNAPLRERSLRARRLYKEAYFYLLEDPDEKRLMSMTSICHHLGIEPNYLRRGIRYRLTHGGDWKTLRLGSPGKIAGATPL